MKNEQQITPEQIALEQKRLKISGAVLRAREERLQNFRFHFNNSDVLEVQFAEYQRTQKAFDKAYSVIATLTMDEADSMMPHLQARHQIAQQCLDLAQKREKDRLKNLRFFSTIFQIFGGKKRTQNAPKITSAQTR